MKRSQEEINKKCKLLESLGFNIEHEDSRVCLHGNLFDFSATEGDAKSIMYEALRQMKIIAREEGIQHIRSNLKSLLDI